MDKHMDSFVETGRGDAEGSPLEAVIRVSHSIFGLDRFKFPQEKGVRV